MIECEKVTSTVSIQPISISGGIASISGTPTETEAWSLDALGNWNSSTVNGTTTGRTFSAQNQVDTVGSTKLSYDANGNTLWDQTGNIYIYDAWNHLVMEENASGVVGATYTYDALGRRITESHSGTTTDLYYSSRDQVIEERQSGTTTAQYVWGPFYVNSMIVRDDTPSGGVLTRRLYAEQDANYNVTSLTNSSGGVVERYQYDPYGAATVMNASGGTLTGGSADGWIYTFQGGRLDPTTGLINFQHRDLSTSLGRWIEQDPAGYVDGANRYTFVGDSPIKRMDPAGLFEIDLQFNAFIPKIS